DEVMSRAESMVVDDIACLRLAIVRHRALLWGRHDGDGSARVLRAAIDVLRSPTMRDFARIAIANTVVFSGDPAAVATIVASMEEDGELERTGLCFPRTVAALLQGQLVQAVALGREGMERRARFDGNAPMGHPALFGLAFGLALAEHGSFSEAETVLAEAYTHAVEHHIPQLHVWLALARGRSALAQGRLPEARRWFMEARSVADQARFTMGLRISLTGVLVCAGQLRDLGNARLAERALRELPDDNGLMWPERHRGYAWFAAAEGRLEDARAELRAGVAEAEARGEHLLQIEMLYEVARLGDAASVLAQCAAVAAHCSGPLIAARVLFVRGVAGGDHSVLAAAEKQFANLGAWVAAAESAAELARVLQRAGRPRDAQGAANRSAQYTSDLTAVATPMLMDAAAGGGLSPRERQIALLAADGRPSKAIAQELGLSVRTVSNHLQNSYLKLGISGRDDLADAIAAYR
ncbi:MAG: LuxR C-terminal-related transcriptional regulator, partial [Ilumatobacteraceae bacterium]